jgi:hypothetical protein
MLHKNREWSVSEFYRPSLEWLIHDLAETLTEHSWCMCQGFQVRDYLFLNDSTSADGASEWAIVKGNHQIESITFGWCSQVDAEKHIRKILQGEYDQSR